MSEPSKQITITDSQKHHCSKCDKANHICEQVVQADTMLEQMKDYSNQIKALLEDL